MLVTAPVVYYGSLLVIVSKVTDATRWLPKTFEAQAAMDRFRVDFDNGDPVIVSWPGCTVDDPRLAQLEDALAELANSPPGTLGRNYFARVWSGYSVVRDMTEGPLSLTREQALERLSGTLVGLDGRASCATVTLTDEGIEHRDEAIPLLESIILSSTGVPPEQLLMAGSAIDGYLTDRETVHSANVLNIPSILLSTFLAWWCLRSWKFTAAVIGTALYSQGLVLSLIYISGAPMSAILIVLSPLMLVLVVSAGVHLVNYYHDEVRRGRLDHAVEHAMQHGRWPCVFAAATTTIGLASLVVSEVDPVYYFGVFAAIGVVAGVGLLFLILPGVMQRYPHVRVEAESSGHPTLLDRIMNRLARFVTTYPRRVAGSLLLMMVAAGVGLVWLQTSIRVDKLFGSRSPTIRNYRVLEDKLGPLIPVEVLIRFPPDAKMKLLDRLELVADLEQQIRATPPFAGTLSAASFAPELPRARSVTAILRRNMVNRRLADHLDALEEANYLHQSPAGQTWRISARVPALTGIDYGDALVVLRNVVSPVLAEVKQHDGIAIQDEYTGVMPLCFKASRILLNDLFLSFLTALAVVYLMMAIALRSARAGLVAMLPNLFPMIVVFGWMGWVGHRVDIGAVMTASVALGIAVDDTFHFLIWFRIESDAGRKSADAVRVCFGHCAKAMLQTTVICSLGMLVFMLSNFLPTRRFAWMIATLLAAALVGDLLMLPALLSTPLGRWFTSKTPAPSPDAVEV